MIVLSVYFDCFHFCNSMNHNVRRDREKGRQRETKKSMSNDCFIALNAIKCINLIYEYVYILCTIVTLPVNEKKTENKNEFSSMVNGHCKIAATHSM